MVAAKTFGLIVVGLASCAAAAAQDNSNLINSSRPTISTSSGIQDKGVLQVELGYDGYPGTPPGNQQAFAVTIYYAITSRVRVDFAVDPIQTSNLSGPPASKSTGVGTIALGGKVVVLPEKTYPGIAIQYEGQLPTASNAGLQGEGQQAILLVSRHWQKYTIQAAPSFVEVNCQQRCQLGGQQALAFGYDTSAKTTLYAEAWGQNVATSNTLPGSYVFAGFLHKFNDNVALNGGLRFGVSDHSSSFGPTLGLTFGRRLAPR
jgi:hypothetical protein